MKKILLLFCFAICASLSYGQIKVQTNGFSKLGDTAQSAARQLHIAGTQGLARIDRWSNSGAGIQMNSFNPTGSQLQKVFTMATVATSTTNGYFTIADQGTNPFGSATRRFQIDASGDVIIGTATNVTSGYRLTVGGSAFKTDGLSDWNILSDKKTKTNIKDYNDGLETILALNPVSYEYNGKGGTPKGESRVGVIAQDLQKVAPSMVSQVEITDPNNGIEIIDGVVPEKKSTDTEEFLTINTSSLQWMLVNAIKDQQKLIDAQAKRLAELEETISTLSTTESTNNTNVTLSNYDLAELSQNSPNPFNGQTTISYTIPTDATNAQILIYSQTGSLMKTLKVDHRGKGTLQVNADDLSSGTYTYQLVVDGRNIQTLKMALTK